VVRGANAGRRSVPAVRISDFRPTSTSTSTSTSTCRRRAGRTGERDRLRRASPSFGVACGVAVPRWRCCGEVEVEVEVDRRLKTGDPSGSPGSPEETGPSEIPGPPPDVPPTSGPIVIAERPTIGVSGRCGKLDHRQMCLN
jgi:hypothetical protein